MHLRNFIFLSRALQGLMCALIALQPLSKWSREAVEDLSVLLQIQVLQNTGAYASIYWAGLAAWELRSLQDARLRESHSIFNRVAVAAAAVHLWQPLEGFSCNHMLLSIHISSRGVEKSHMLLLLVFFPAYHVVKIKHFGVSFTLISRLHALVQGE